MSRSGGCRFELTGVDGLLGILWWTCGLTFIAKARQDEEKADVKEI